MTIVLAPAELAQLERLVLRPERRVPASAPGPHRSAARGRSLDVVEWREYQPGDDPRSIDVQAWARLDQVLVRRYEADVDLRVQLIVDTSASMSFGAKHRHAVRIAAAIGVSALVRNETVTLSRLSEPTPRRYRGRAALGPFLDRLGSWEASGPTPLVEQARVLAAATRRAGMIVVVSDFLTAETITAIDRLAARREQLVAIQVISAADEQPDTLGEVQLVDVETAALVDVDLSPAVVARFAERRRAARAVLSDRLARHGGRLVVTDAEDDLLTATVPRLVAGGVLT